MAVTPYFLLSTYLLLYLYPQFATLRRAKEIFDKLKTNPSPITNANASKVLQEHSGSASSIQRNLTLQKNVTQKNASLGKFSQKDVSICSNLFQIYKDIVDEYEAELVQCGVWEREEKVPVYSKKPVLKQGVAVRPRLQSLHPMQPALRRDSKHMSGPSRQYKTIEDIDLQQIEGDQSERGYSLKRAERSADGGKGLPPPNVKPPWLVAVKVTVTFRLFHFNNSQAEVVEERGLLDVSEKVETEVQTGCILHRRYILTSRYHLPRGIMRRFRAKYSDHKRIDVDEKNSEIIIFFGHIQVKKDERGFELHGATNMFHSNMSVPLQNIYYLGSEGEDSMEGEDFDNTYLGLAIIRLPWDLHYNASVKPLCFPALSLLDGGGGDTGGGCGAAKVEQLYVSGDGRDNVTLHLRQDYDSGELAVQDVASGALLMQDPGDGAAVLADAGNPLTSIRHQPVKGAQASPHQYCLAIITQGNEMIKDYGNGTQIVPEAVLAISTLALAPWIAETIREAEIGKNRTSRAQNSKKATTPAKA